MDDLAAHPLIIEWRDLLSRLDLLTLDQGEEALAIMEYDLQVAREALELELELAVEEALELELELAVEEALELELELAVEEALEEDPDAALVESWAD